MEQLQQKHQKENKDLQALITQKRKAASKKNRKRIEADCIDLEARQKERHAYEMAQANESVNDEVSLDEPVSKIEIADASERPDTAEDKSNPPEEEPAKPLENSLNALSLQPNGVHRKSNRQKARLARRAAEAEAQVAQAVEEAANMPNLRDQERAAMSKVFEKNGLVEFDIIPDGHCLYNAIADQLNFIRDGSRRPAAVNCKDIRAMAADFIQKHPDDFSPFLDEPLDSYADKLRNTAEWGGHLELSALSKALEIPINVIQGGNRIERLCPDPESTESEDDEIWLAYYRHVYGLGEHYNSLRRKN